MLKKEKKKSRYDPIQKRPVIRIRALSCPPLEKRVDYRAPRPPGNNADILQAVYNQSPYTCWEQWVLCSVAHARKWPSQDLFELVVTHCSTVPVDEQRNNYANALSSVPSPNDSKRRSTPFRPFQLRGLARHDFESCNIAATNRFIAT